MKTDTLPCYIIYKMDVNVKSKNPAKNGPPLWKYALLDICRPKDEKAIPQRMVIEVEWQEKKMYKVRIDTLEGVIKQLETNNKVLAKITPINAVNAKLIKGNNKQIQVIKDAAPILA